MSYRPTRETIDGSNVKALWTELGLSGYRELYEWSIADRGAFWARVLDRLGVAFQKRPDRVLDDSAGARAARWLPGVELNITDSCFAAPAEATAIVAGREGSEQLRWVGYGELEEEVARVAAGLRAHGFEPGDGIALCMPMGVECVIAYLAILRAGCHAVSIAESFAADEIRRRLEISGARAVVTVEAMQRGGKSFALYERVVQAGAPTAIVVGAGRPSRLGDLTWDALRRASSGGSAVAHVGDHVANVLFSSGTTGVPKAIPWTHLTPIKCAMDGHFHQDIQPGDVVCWPTSIGWMMGPWLIFAALVNRATIALYDGAPNHDGFGRFVRDAGVSVLGTVPSLVRAWRRAGTVGPELAAVRVFSSTGEPSHPDDYGWLTGATGDRAPVIEYCGGTEIGGGYIAGTVVQPMPPSVFTTPTLGTEIVVLGADGEPVGEGEEGEVYLLPPALGSSSTLLNADHDEVYFDGCPAGPGGAPLRRHGDRLEALPGGMFRARGRADDAMNLGGVKVGPIELEAVIDSHENVVESAAVAVPLDGDSTDRLVVFARLQEEASPEQLRGELSALIAERVNPLFRIHEVVVVDGLPRTATNKLMRRELRRQYLGS